MGLSLTKRLFSRDELPISRYMPIMLSIRNAHKSVIQRTESRLFLISDDPFFSSESIKRLGIISIADLSTKYNLKN